MAARFAATRRAVGELILRRLVDLPDRIRVPMLDGRELLLVHGSPSDRSNRSVTSCRTTTCASCSPTIRPTSSSAARPRAVRACDRRVQVINVGSVGLAPGGWSPLHRAA